MMAIFLSTSHISALRRGYTLSRPRYRPCQHLRREISCGRRAAPLCFWRTICLILEHIKYLLESMLALFGDIGHSCFTVYSRSLRGSICQICCAMSPLIDVGAADTTKLHYIFVASALWRAHHRQPDAHHLLLLGCGAAEMASAVAK